MEVIGKREGTKGLMFKEPEYVIALRVVDEGSQPTVQKEIPFHQYSALEVGDTLPVEMYTTNGHGWYFSEEEARLFAEIRE